MPQRGDDRDFGHCKLHERCGICGFTFDTDDPIAGLIFVSSETDGKATFKALDAFFFATVVDKYLMGRTYFCRSRFCLTCPEQPETTTVHVDCYNLFLRLASQSERLARLYRVATSKFPWKTFAARSLETPRDVKSIISHAAESLCFDSLERLPYEIKAEICNYLGTGVLRRLDVVQRIVRDMPTETGEWFNSVPLAHVQYWERGALPVLQKHAAVSPRRLVMDFQGIRIIESSEAPARSGRPGAELYVVAAPVDSKCEFRYGTCRLMDQGSGEKPRVWNVPNPPRLEDCTSDFSRARNPDCLAAIDLSACFGITFFTSYTDLLRIHAHTKSRPTAEETFMQIERSEQSSAAWIYVPLPPEDTPTGFGVTSYLSVGGRRTCNRVNHCFRTSLAGDFTVGPWCKATHTVYNISRQSTLVHDLEDPRNFQSPYKISHIQPQSTACADFSPAAPHNRPHDSIDCFSSARLESIRRVWIYRCKDGRFCKGLIIDYMNGAQRALGSCAVGVTPAECCTEFRHIRFRLVPESFETDNRVNAPSVTIEVSPETDNESQDEGWTRFVEGAVLEVWFTNFCMFMYLF